MLTLHFNRDSFEWEYVGGDTPAGDAMNRDPIMQTIIRYLQQKRELRGTASELIELLGLPIKSNVLSKRLNQYQNELRKIGVTVERSRTGERRELLLGYAAARRVMTV